MKLLDWPMALYDWLRRKRQRRAYIRVADKPHPSTLDALGRERLQTYGRSRSDLS